MAALSPNPSPEGGRGERNEPPRDFQIKNARIFALFSNMDTPYKIPESVLVVIHTSALDVLLIERADRPGYWQSVTGSKETPDEPLRDTAVREVWEETGIRISDDNRRGRSSPASAGGVPLSVPRTQLRDWRLCNIYEIYPAWRHRYAG